VQKPAESGEALLLAGNRIMRADCQADTDRAFNLILPLSLSDSLAQEKASFETMPAAMLERRTNGTYYG
jgi:hypothetical protein